LYQLHGSKIFKGYGDLFPLMQGWVQAHPGKTLDDAYKVSVIDMIAFDDWNRRTSYVNSKIQEERRKNLK
jgi:hypothetical protein